MASYEMNAFRSEYQKAVVSNAKAFARALNERGLAVEGNPAIGYTETHQVIIRVGYGKGLSWPIAGREQYHRQLSGRPG